MDSPWIKGALQYYINYIYMKEDLDVHEMMDEIRKTSIRPESYKKLKDRHLEFSTIFLSAISELRQKFDVIKELKTDYAVSYFHNKLNVVRQTYNSWKNMGYFKNEFGPEKKRRIPIGDIEEFLERMPKYKKFWEKPD